MPRRESLTIQETCGRFRQLLSTGESPRIEEYVQGWEEPERTELLKQLVEIELTFRQATGETLLFEDFQERFPEDKAALNGLEGMAEQLSETKLFLSDAPENVETIDFSLGSIKLGSNKQRTVPDPDIPDEVTLFGDYEILEQLGYGGMGIVFKARERSLNRLVALKMIRAGELASEEEIKRFHAEAEAAAALDHPHIVPIYEVGKEDELHFFSMAYVNGAGLDTRLRTGPLPPQEAAECLRTIARAVHYAHQKGIVHRDLKPANILIDANGEPRVTDFGLARNIATDSRLTITGQIMGTPSFMPPEQARGDLVKVGSHSDTYSLGATLYALLTGRPPFQAANSLETLKQVIEEEPVSPRQLNRTIGRDLETICLKCLRKEPTARYASAEELAEDLDRWLNHQPIIARPVSLMEKSWLWCKRRPALVGSLIVILLSLLIGTGVVLEQRRQNAVRIVGVKQENDRKRAASHVENALTAPAAAFPYVMQLIEPLQEHAVPILREQFSDTESPQNRRLHAAMALAHFGEMNTLFLVRGIPTAGENECANLIQALKDVPNAIKQIEVAVRREMKLESPDWERIARLAIVALFLGDSHLIDELCQPRPDPIRQTILVDTFPRWHGDLRELVAIIEESAHPSTQSTIISALGLIPGKSLSEEEQKAWKPLFGKLLLNAEEGHTHSAVAFTAGEWGVAVPKPPVRAEPAGKQQWYRNSLGITMMNVPVGSFKRGGNHEPLQKVLITKPFLLGATEISVAEFQQFLDDPEYPAEKKPAEWKGVDVEVSPTHEHPVQSLTWHEAIQFCNWLSLREGLTPCYTFQENGRRDQEWKWDQEADGYRLPTEAEWEHACRSQTVTTYPSGDEIAYLKNYAVYHVNQAEPCAGRIPNGLGFFDMQGNVKEWCFDLFSQQYVGEIEVNDPIGPATGRGRIIRGGCYRGGSSPIRSASRGYGNPRASSEETGFRIARNLSPAS